MAPGYYSFELATRSAGRSSMSSALGGGAAAGGGGGSAIGVGTLALDGVATPYEIALILPITGSPDADTTTTVTYWQKNTASPASLGQDSSGSPITAHPLFRLVDNSAFAWTIFGTRDAPLLPGATYTVKVVIDNAGNPAEEQTIDVTTRALPPRAPLPTSTITVGTSTASIKAAIEALSAGQCIQFADGTHTVDVLQLALSAGTPTAPIYIRGTSRESTIITDTTGAVLTLLTCDNVVLENLTLVGSGTDSGTSASSIGVYLHSSFAQSNITIRDVTIYDVDKGIVTFDHEVSGCMVYDCILVGNNVWNTTFIDSNITWNDDGIQLAGNGNCAFRNTLKGFGDTIAVTYSNATAATYNCHYHHNDIYNSCDDLIEADDSHRNITFRDNRSHNSMTALSLDALIGGPLIFARNTVVNIGRTPFKWNATNTGQFVYQNTIIWTAIESFREAIAGWYQADNGSQNSFGLRNNAFVYRGAAPMLIRLDNLGYDPVDWTNNAWYPDNDFNVDNQSNANLAAAIANAPTSAGIFPHGGAKPTKRFTNDEITVNNPWSNTITLGASYLNEVALQPDPVPNHSSLLNQGVAIDGITTAGDTTPDIGALQSGAEVPLYGNTLPSWVKAMAVGDWYEIPNTALSSVAPAITPTGSPSNKINAWTSFVTDTRSSKIYSVASGGHSDYAGNEVDELDLARESPRWTERLAPTPNASLLDDDYYADGRPASRHQYYGVTLDEFNDRIMLFLGSRWQDGSQPRSISSYNIAQNRYSPDSEHTSFGAAISNFGGVSYDPATGDAYINTPLVGSKWTRSTNTTTTDTGASGTLPLGYYTSSAWDTLRKRLYFLGSSIVFTSATYDPVANAWTARTLSGANAGDVDGGDLMGMVYVPALDRFLVRQGSVGGGAVFQVNPSTFEVTTFTTSGGASIPTTVNGPCNKFLYVPKLGICVHVPTYTGNAWALKVHDAEPTVP